MTTQRMTGLLFAAAAALMMPSAAANDAARSKVVPPGPWLELMHSEAAAIADPMLAELHERARQSFFRVRTSEMER